MTPLARYSHPAGLDARCLASHAAGAYSCLVVWICACEPLWPASRPD
jgi:hypothetical protein